MKACRRFTALAIGFASVVVTATASDNPRQAFIKSWEGRTVVVKRALHTLAYNERGRLGNTYRQKRDGLTVVTPLAGMYFQFDGRQSQDDITARDPQRVVDAVTATYQKDVLDLRAYQKVEPLLLTRYDPGVELVVSTVRIERDSVRLSFADVRNGAGGAEPVTTLTVKWPMPLSRSFSERDTIEGLIRQFVEAKETR